MQEETKVLPKRTSRGRRNTALVGEAADADKSFWDQDAFKEDSGDSEFDSTDASSDSEDSDIDNDEGDAANDDGEEADDDLEAGQQSKRAYLDPALRRKMGIKGLMSGVLGAQGSDTPGFDAKPIIFDASVELDSRAREYLDRVLQRSAELQSLEAKNRGAQ